VISTKEMKATLTVLFQNGRNRKEEESPASKLSSQKQGITRK
jgi:hypothetical protein